ncbi:MAG: sugar kinase [Candidatus Sumerlaeia bacterium]|nr:sugar kinase [Candidatus Sumerlaeia bacterium]
MSKTLIVGSVALDSVETPHGKVSAALGGSASYASVAASYFNDVSIVGVVGTDFNGSHIEKFRSRNIDLSGLQTVEGKTFHWSGYYERDMNQAFTHTTELNVFADFSPKLTEEQRQAEFVFLANIHPALQLDVLNKIANPRVVAVDTMNYWIEGQKQLLTKVVERCDILLVNDQEARQFCEKVNLIECGRDLLKLGPRTIVLKKGEHGALLFQKDRIVYFPAYPLENIKDPTGAGDSFAGGMVGYLSRLGEVTDDNLVRGVLAGTCMASFVVEDFSLDRLLTVNNAELEERAARIYEMVSLPPIDPATLLSRS